MRIFQYREIKQAYEHVAAGGQALHIGVPYLCSDKAQDAVAHLLDQDYDRLARTAKGLGIEAIVPEHVGTHRQRIELRGKFLDRAINCAEHQRACKERRERERVEAEKSTLCPVDLNAALP